MHVSLIVPAAFDQVSDDYAYDRRIADGLRADGHTVALVEVPGRFPLCDDEARDAACIAWDRLAEPTRPVIDAAALPAFSGMEDALTARGTIGVIHHPSAWETGLADADSSRLRGIEQRLYARLYRLVVACDATAHRLADEWRLDRGRIAVVAPGTDDAPRCLGSGDPVCHILSVGLLIPRKGHDVLLRALSRLPDLQWRLSIVGSSARNPAYAEGLADLAVELGIPHHVHFAGNITGIELESLWRQTDVFALATWFEGCGMAIAEALKRGLPIAVTSGGAASALVEAEAGVVCEPGDHAQLGKALRRLIFSPPLRREMGEVAWQTGQTLPTWTTQARAFATALSA